MLQPAGVGVEEGAQIRHAIFQHRQPVDADAEGEALIAVGIDAAVSEHVGVNHAAAQNLHPVLALAEADLAALAPALNVDLHRRLGEGEEGRTEAQLNTFHLKEAL